MSLRLSIVKYANVRAKLLRRALIHAGTYSSLVTLALATGPHIYDRILPYTEYYAHRVSDHFLGESLSDLYSYQSQRLIEIELYSSCFVCWSRNNT